MSALKTPSNRLQRKSSTHLGPASCQTPQGGKAGFGSSSASQQRLVKKPATSQQARSEHWLEAVRAVQTAADLALPAAAALPELPEGRKTLVFDLDETLVHCTSEDPDATLALPGSLKKVGVKIRPFAVECLREASKLFEVAVFTASRQEYADVVLDYLDPEHEYIQHRLYRSSCVLVDGTYVKDLRVLGNRDLSQVVLVDNSVAAFARQISNGVPIRSWANDKHDRELLKLLDYLKVLEKARDVREVNRAKFHLELRLQEFQKVPPGFKRSLTLRA